MYVSVPISSGFHLCIYLKCFPMGFIFIKGHNGKLAIAAGSFQPHAGCGVKVKLPVPRPMGYMVSVSNRPRHQFLDSSLCRLGRDPWHPLKPQAQACWDRKHPPPPLCSSQEARYFPARAHVGPTHASLVLAQCQNLDLNTHQHVTS